MPSDLNSEALEDEWPPALELKDVSDQFPWFVERMMNDTWTFGLLVTGNLVIVIDQIDNIRAPGGIVWLDVTMREKSNWDVKKFTTLPENLTLMYSPTRRQQASVRADAVIAAFELADT